MLKYGFYACVFLLSLGQFAVIGRTGLGTMSVSDLAVAAFALAGCAYFLARKRAAVPKYLLAFFVFAFVAMLSLGFNFHKLAFEDFGVAFLYLARFIVYLLGGVVLYNMLRTKMMAPSAILAAFGASAIFVAVVGFIQLVVLPDYSVLDLALGFDPHKNRLGSTFFDPNFTAGYLALVVSLLLGSIRGKKSGAALKLVLALAVLTIAVFLTFSRSGWLMLGVVVFVFGMLRYRWMLLAALLIAFLAYFAVPRVQTRITGATDPADSARFRLISWKRQRGRGIGFKLSAGFGHNRGFGFCHISLCLFLSGDWRRLENSRSFAFGCSLGRALCSQPVCKLGLFPADIVFALFDACGD
ncbi:MAG: hypothetical protein UX79_C0014G0002 [candidate division WWE3 bacterium GW2011_GWB1_47_11]|uniref:O-antigen polymerase n=1 Tax=candidate division WWE3 bacterium GW2011_GWB1_47_11 TaxID=1619117 RepID=A0A0G1RJ36_UNCKA|nr:MAG: hypothetical protein UX79_C0014G0002 [candidate division WWE3 bacterium GW2011_GWB1_47_11]